MSQHKIKQLPGFIDCQYDGEDRDDGNANELSLQVDGADPHRLSLLLSNNDHAGRQFDNTYSLTPQEAQAIGQFLIDWSQQQ